MRKIIVATLALLAVVLTLAPVRSAHADQREAQMMQRHSSIRITRRVGWPAIALGLAVLSAIGLTITTAAASPAGRALLPPPPNPVGPQADPGGITLIGGGIFIPQPVERSAQAAATVVQATVTAVEPSLWNTPDGQRPAGATAATLSRDAFIYTPITVQVTHGFKNAAAGQTLTFDILGGKVAPDLYIDRTEPTYQVGEPLLLFLDGARPVPGSTQFLVFARDVFRVTSDGQVVALHYPATLNLQDVQARIARALGQS